MDRLLRQVSTRSWLLLSPTRSLSSLKGNSFDFKPHVLLNCRHPLKSHTEFPYDHHPQFPLPGQIGFVKQNESIAISKTKKSLGKLIRANCAEIRAFDCSLALRSDLKNLFSNYNTLTQPLTAITMVFHTKSDMSTWSTEVEHERNELMKTFHQLACEVSNYLRSKDYWVDFIDPSNGKPYYASTTTDILLETDERFRHLGIEIVDLGCCRAIEHFQYG